MVAPAARPGRSNDPVPTGAAFGPIEHLRSHEYVAEQLRRQIGLRLVRSGEALPSERELAALFGVGKATVEAAIRILEADLLVTVRRGRHGGTFVTADSGDGLRRDYLLVRLRRDPNRICQALAFRSAVEPFAAALAAPQRTQHDLDRLEQAADDVANAADDPAFMAADTEFHLAIAAAAQNAFVGAAVEHMRLVLNDALAALPDSPLWRRRSVEEHAPIAAAIVSGDGQGASRLMRAHLASTEKSVEALLKAL